MVAVIAFVCLIIGGFTFVILRISVSGMFWFSKNPNDKAYVFTTQFPYYIIILFGLGTTVIVKFDFEPYLIYYTISNYFMALFIWNFKLNLCKKTYSTTGEIIEQQNPNLP